MYKVNFDKVEDGFRLTIRNVNYHAISTNNKINFVLD